jgi:hypothetical protein
MNSDASAVDSTLPPVAREEMILGDDPVERRYGPLKLANGDRKGLKTGMS